MNKLAYKLMFCMSQGKSEGKGKPDDGWRMADDSKGKGKIKRFVQKGAKRMKGEAKARSKIFTEGREGNEGKRMKAKSKQKIGVQKVTKDAKGRG
jgi:hypothetical protein